MRLTRFRESIRYLPGVLVLVATGHCAADDINKLPEAGVGEALQRISGVQISRDRGESRSIAIRGLNQVETVLNGQELFAAGPGRAFDYADMPAELITGIDAYKTSWSAQRVAYNLRDRHLPAATSVGGPPIYTKAHGWLDAALGYRLDNTEALVLEGMNLLDTARCSYYDTATRPQSRIRNDVQVAGIRMRSWPPR